MLCTGYVNTPVSLSLEMSLGVCVCVQARRLQGQAGQSAIAMGVLVFHLCSLYNSVTRRSLVDSSDNKRSRHIDLR